MKVVFLFIFSQGLWANTLLETETAVGIANTLQGTAQGNPQQVLNQVKENVNNYEHVQEQKMNSIQAPANNNPSAQQRIPQSLPTNNQVLEQATLSDQEKNQIQELNHSLPPSSTANDLDSFNTPPNVEDGHNIEGIKEPAEEVTAEYFKPERIVEMEERPIDYKTSTQVFYKNDCLSSQSNCKRSGAVFTNIKSVIFNYAHSRGSFSETK